MTSVQVGLDGRQFATPESASHVGETVLQSLSHHQMTRLRHGQPVVVEVTLRDNTLTNQQEDSHHEHRRYGL